MSRYGIEVELDPEMTGAKIINTIPALKEGPAAIAERALTAEAAWRVAEPQAEEAKTAAGTEPVSNAETSFGNKNCQNQRPDNTAITGRHMAISNKIIILTHHHPEPPALAPVSDLRANKRFNHEAHLIIQNCDCGTYAYGRMYNYSRGGLYFESNDAFRPGSCVRVDIEDSPKGPAKDHYFATVKWCRQVCGAVVLYDFAVGLEFDRAMNGSAVSSKLSIIQGGAGKKAG